jgi:hypothetical protein
MKKVLNKSKTKKNEDKPITRDDLYEFANVIIGTINKKIDNVEKGQESLEKRQEGLEKRQGNVEDILERNNKLLVKLEWKIDAHTGLLLDGKKFQDEEIKSLNKKVKKLELAVY